MMKPIWAAEWRRRRRIDIPIIIGSFGNDVVVTAAVSINNIIVEGQGKTTEAALDHFEQGIKNVMSVIGNDNIVTSDKLVKHDGWIVIYLE